MIERNLENTAHEKLSSSSINAGFQLQEEHACLIEIYSIGSPGTRCLFFYRWDMYVTRRLLRR